MARDQASEKIRQAPEAIQKLDGPIPDRRRRRDAGQHCHGRHRGALLNLAQTGQVTSQNLQAVANLAAAHAQSVTDVSAALDRTHAATEAAAGTLVHGRPLAGLVGAHEVAQT